MEDFTLDGRDLPFFKIVLISSVEFTADTVKKLKLTALLIVEGWNALPVNISAATSKLIPALDAKHFFV